MELFNQPQDNPSALVWIFIGFSAVMLIALTCLYFANKKPNGAKPDPYDDIHNKMKWTDNEKTD